MARIKRAKPDDELTLVEHLDELRTRLIVSISVLVVAVSACYYENHRIYHLLTSALPAGHRQLYTFAPGEAFFNAITISVYGGLLISLPILSYQFYAYVIPAFSEDSQKTIKPMLLLIPGLFLIGVVFGWFIVVPAALKFLVNYNSTVVHYFPRASDYIHFVAYTELAMGIVFELPVVMMMLGRVGILRSSMMKRRWREAVVALAVIAALLPGTDPVTMTAEYLPMLLLYWISYFLVKAVEPKRGISDILSEPFA
ncbi:MAG TPA: twin-arginine translocase subunit TatC [Gaiellales bacterium]|nr:twin-arginine translocase subunit TatC [Gaiellales bacterium]